jgi:hypothetical protein
MASAVPGRISFSSLEAVGERARLSTKADAAGVGTLTLVLRIRSRAGGYFGAAPGSFTPAISIFVDVTGVS